MTTQQAVSPRTFIAMQNVDVDLLSDLSDAELRPILPCLVRMSLCAPLDSSDKWTHQRKKILKCLSGIEVVNSLVGLLSIDFHALEQDARKEQQLRTKLGNAQNESMLISQLQQSVALEFERSDAPRKLRLLLSELLFVMAQVHEPRNTSYHKSSELFENEVYLEEVSDVLCTAQAELPALLPIAEVCEALLHMPSGIWLMSRLLTNVPDSFTEVCSHLIANGPEQDEDDPGSRLRTEALLALCNMNPGQTLALRAMCVECCKMPGLAVALTLHHYRESASVQSQSGPADSDLVAFVTGLLLGSSSNVRSWFAQFVKAGHKRKTDPQRSMLHALRTKLLEDLSAILPEDSNKISETQAVQGCGYIRLYCALKGIAALKFSESEVKVILRLLTCRPPHTSTGVRFVSLGLCMLLACPYLIGNTDLEKQAIEWIRWLVKEVSHFEKASAGSGSFGEMLLLIAIHFHSNQTHAIADLVCSTLGMKSAVKANALARMKAIFIQEVFTEQVVTSHAVKVAVTKGLNANMSGYLPVHCIYQLLKSRAFSKHKVPIKKWIYRQICSSSTPIHPLLPPLIDVYIQSIILPSTKTDRTNEPITEQEILSVFKDTVFTKHHGKGAGKTDEEPMEVDDAEGSNFTAQLLLLYYVLLYQDTLLSNMKTIVAANRTVKSYSQHLLAQLPMKYQLLRAQKEQQLYAGLFSPLLRLLATHYPQLCLVEDWLDEELSSAQTLSNSVIKVPGLPCNEQTLQKAFMNLESCPSQALLLLEQLAMSPATEVLPYVETIIDSLPQMLDPNIPRKILVTTKKVWIKLNTIIPRKLRVMTVNALRTGRKGAFKVTPYTEDDITIDPLIVLRCDDRLFRCPPLLEITLRILEAFLSASRTYLATHIQANPVADKSGQIASVQEREELRTALLASQESATVQLLLEHCLPKPQEQDQAGLLNELREVQCLVCSLLHQMFIADPNLAKLVHFQGYPSELLPVTVAGIPSMHICLDFIPELLSQPHMEKQIFAIELVSYLSLQYALPKSLGIAKLAINVMTTLLGVLPSETRADFFLPALPSLVRICKAFPPLCEDGINLLIQLGRVSNSHMANATNAIFTDTDSTSSGSPPLPRKGAAQSLSSTIPEHGLPKHRELLRSIHRSFSDIVNSAALLKPLKPTT